jgi:methylated-DNA-[protein]-cysteine S-methyltransferase
MSEHAWLKTKLGWIHCQGNEAGITRADFAEKPPAVLPRGGPTTAKALEAIERYFAGELGALEEVAIAPAGTAFQKSVWSALRGLHSGEFISYAELAERLGRPRALRPVGQANAKNPIALFVPCHRVVASDGSIGGYAWGTERKAYLLAHERVISLKPRERKVVVAAPPAPAPLPLFEMLAR